MAEAAQYLISIEADGSGAITALDGVNNSFAKLVQTHDDVKGRFQESFQHVGVHLFGRELLNTIGLGGEARVVLASLNLAVEETATAMGLAGGTVGIAVAGLTALAAIIYKVVEAHEKHKESLDATIKSLTGDIENTGQLRDKLEDYRNTVGVLTPGLEGLAKANEALYNAQRALLEIELTEKIKNLGDQIEEQGKKAAMATSADAANAAVLATYAAGTDAAAAASNNLAESLDKQDVETKKLEASRAMAVASLESLRAGHTGVNTEIEKGIAAARQLDQEQTNEFSDWMSYLDQMRAGIDKQAQAWDKEIGAEETAAMKSMKLQDERLAKVEHFFGVQANEELAAAALAGRVSQGISSAFGNAFAKMLVEGKNFTEQLQSSFKSMAESIIADLTKMIIEQEIFNSLVGMGMFGGGVPAIGQMGVAGYAPGVGFGGGPSANFAMGTDSVFDTPTPILVGDGGEPERVQVTPLSQGGGVGGGGQVNNVSITLNVSGVNDPRELAEQAAPHLIDIIRGRGNLSFTGPNIG